MAARRSGAVSASALALLLAVPLAAQGKQHIGETLPKVELSFANIKAKSIDDLAGRAILIEFFAYW